MTPIAITIYSLCLLLALCSLLMWSTRRRRRMNGKD